MKLVDKQEDGTFGKFFGHPGGESRSKEYVLRMLKEFNFTPEYFEDLILSGSVSQGEYVTALQDPLCRAFTQRGWNNKPYYPESNYQADFGYKQDNRWIFVEIELSDIRRAVNALYMSRVFRTGYMRLGIFIAPESHAPEKSKGFYSSLTKRYAYLAPDFPLWVIGFELP
jgi:hypothetical protein